MNYRIESFYLWLLLFSMPSWATTYYVSPSGSGTTCSATSACSLGTGISKAVGGDEVVLKDGTYDEQKILTVRSGSSGNPIVIRAENRHKAIVALHGPDGSYGAPNGRVCELRHNYVTLRGVVCDGKGYQSMFGIDGYLGAPITGVLAEYNIFRNGHGTHFGDTYGPVIVRHNLFDANGLDGEVWYIGKSAEPGPGRDLQIYGNLVTNQTWEAIDTKVSEANHDIHHNIFEYKRLPQCYPCDPSLPYAKSFMTIRGSGHRIHDNIFRHGQDVQAPIVVNSTADDLIYGNVFYDLSRDLGTQYSVYDGGTQQNVQIFENTFCSMQGYGYNGFTVSVTALNIYNNNGIPGNGAPQADCDAEAARIIKEIASLSGYPGALPGSTLPSPTPTDTTPPAISITSPADGSLVVRNSPGQ